MTDSSIIGLTPLPQTHALWDQEWRAHLLEIGGDRVRQQVDPEQYRMR